MSVKEQIVKALDALPESLTLEEAVEQLYRAFQRKQLGAPASLNHDGNFKALLRAMSAVGDDQDFARPEEAEPSWAS